MININHSPRLASLSNFSEDSRVWVYISNRRLTTNESVEVQQQLDAFCKQWTAHNQALLAAAEVFEQQFIILMVDETQAGASGCSIDKSVHFLENLGETLNVDFFERMRFAWIDNNEQMTFSNPAELSTAVKNQEITDATLMANTLVQTKRELSEKWLLPFRQSWHRRIVAAH